MSLTEYQAHCDLEGCPNLGKAVANYIKFLKKLGISPDAKNHGF